MRNHLRAFLLRRNQLGTGALAADSVGGIPAKQKKRRKGRTSTE